MSLNSNADVREDLGKELDMRNEGPLKIDGHAT